MYCAVLSVVVRRVAGVHNLGDICYRADNPRYARSGKILAFGLIMPETIRDLRSVWRQSVLPVVFRGGQVAPLLAKLPYRDDNRSWLGELGRRRPEWIATQQAWSLPKAWFEPLIQLCLRRYEKCYVIQPTNRAEKCAPACWNALGVTCECSCLGENHGSGSPEGRWHIVSETFAVRVGNRDFACRLLLRDSRERA